MTTTHNKDPNAWMGANNCQAANVSRGDPLVNGAALTSGVLELSLIYIPGGASVSSIIFYAGATAISGATHQIFGIYTAEAAPVRQCFTTDHGANGWAAWCVKLISVSGGPWICPASGLYYAAIMVVASTPPTIVGSTLPHVNLSNQEVPIVCGTADTGLVTTIPSTAAALTSTTAFRGCWLNG